VAVEVGLFVGPVLRAEDWVVAVVAMVLVLVRTQRTTGQVEALVVATAQRVWAAMVSRALFWSK
jgi:hypothetical protein